MNDSCEIDCTAIKNKIVDYSPLASEQTLEQLINSIFEKSQDAVIGVDASGHIGYWNKQFSKLFGLGENATLQGKHGSELLCGADSICQSNSCSQCAVEQNFRSETQISEFKLDIKSLLGELVKVNIGTCYFYQDDPAKVSTYFSLRKINGLP